MDVREDLVIQQLGPRNQAAILKLMRGCGQSSCGSSHVFATNYKSLDNSSRDTLPLAKLMAGVFLAGQLTGFVQAYDGVLTGASRRHCLWMNDGVGRGSALHFLECAWIGPRNAKGPICVSCARRLTGQCGTSCKNSERGSTWFLGN